MLMLYLSWFQAFLWLENLDCTKNNSRIPPAFRFLTDLFAISGDHRSRNLEILHLIWCFLWLLLIFTPYHNYETISIKETIS